ncbi:MAG: glycosyltransferase involved in cell wall biosynthesis [Polaribacter sp.]
MDHRFPKRKNDLVEIQRTSPLKTKPTMRILHISSAKSWRGGEQQIAYLIEELRTEGISQEAFCPKDSPLEIYCKKNNIICTTYKKRFSVNPLVARKLSQYSSRNNFDLVHLHDSHAHTFACMAAAFYRMSTPMVLHRRVDFPVGGSALSKWKYNHPGIKAMICVSHFVKAVLSKTVNEAAKIKVVHSGVDLNRFPKQQKNKLREEFQVPDEIAIVANVAAITEQKDYHTFVRTAERLLKEKTKAHFFIIGEGKQRKEIEAYVKELGLDEKITFTGFRKDITEIFSNIDVLLFSSQTEGLGTTLLDAQLCGVPIVATNVGGIPEIVEHENTGLLANRAEDEVLAKHVRLLLSDNTARKQMAERARKSVEQFSKSKMAKGVLGIYKEVFVEER